MLHAAAVDLTVSTADMRQAIRVAMAEGIGTSD